MLKESSPKNWGTSTNFKVLPKETVAEKSPNLVALLARAREKGVGRRACRRERNVNKSKQTTQFFFRGVLMTHRIGEKKRRKNCQVSIFCL
jgi:hypothetical protein